MGTAGYVTPGKIFSQGASVHGGEQLCGDSSFLEERLIRAFESVFD